MTHDSAGRGRGAELVVACALNSTARPSLVQGTGSDLIEALVENRLAQEIAVFRGQLIGLKLVQRLSIDRDIDGLRSDLPEIVFRYFYDAVECERGGHAY